MQSTYLCEQALNSLFTLCNKSFQSNESYEDKIRILQNEKILLNDVIYTKYNNTEKSVIEKAFDVSPTTSIVDNLLDVINSNTLVAQKDAEVDVATALENFFIDGNYRTNIIIMPAAGALNGREYCNLIIRISSMRDIVTNNLLQKNITVDYGIVSAVHIMTFNINSDAVNVNRNGSSLFGTHNTSLDKCNVTYRGFERQFGRNVQTEFRWQRTPGGNYFVTSYVVDDENDQQLNLSAIWYLGDQNQPGGTGM
jgi:hypothetical protein